MAGMSVGCSVFLEVEFVASPLVMGLGAQGDWHRIHGIGWGLGCHVLGPCSVPLDHIPPTQQGIPVFDYCM